jgi:hypothetical protein
MENLADEAKKVMAPTDIKKFLVINWKDKNEPPLRLIVLNEDGNPDDDAVEECINVIIAHRRQSEHRFQQLVRVLL